MGLARPTHLPRALRSASSFDRLTHEGREETLTAGGVDSETLEGDKKAGDNRDIWACPDDIWFSVWGPKKKEENSAIWAPPRESGARVTCSVSSPVGVGRARQSSPPFLAR